VKKETQMNADDTCDITTTLTPTPPGHALTRAAAEKQFTAVALSRGAVSTTHGTAENGDWSFKAHFPDDDFALAFATHLRNLNPKKCEVFYHDVYEIRRL
jgi:hypothetical protein